VREKEVSEIDKIHLKIIRKNVSSFLKKCAEEFGGEGILLDIAPQNHEGATPYFSLAQIYTLDINPEGKTDFIGDICKNNSEMIADSFFDFVVCTEVLEHTSNPFFAVNEIYRILKNGGYAFVSTPFNFRIHGPLPDCWRFTKYGLETLFKQFKIIKLEEIPTKGRSLMPIHFTVVTQKIPV
jgi:SAM-dependent methyltransferase